MGMMKNLLETGKSERRSTEYFNRYKGTEHSLELRTFEGEEYLLGVVTEHGGGCPSDSEDTFVLGRWAEAQEWVAAHSDKDGSFWLGNLARAFEVPKGTYDEALKQGTPVPVCPHCGQRMPLGYRNS